MKVLGFLFGVAVYFWCCRKGWPMFAHWLVHRNQWEYGALVLWRRSTDKVMMSGRRCPICGKLICIRPVRVSYKRMMRGEKYY